MSQTTPITKPCGHCGKEFLAKYQWEAQRHQLYCGRACYMASYRQPEKLAERFWAKVDKSPHPLGCWIWTACRSTVTKYGTFSYKGSNINAHRAAWLLTNGPIEQAGMDVLHTCDNGIGGCVNPAHLYLGTDKDNVRDKLAAWRQNASVTPEQVRQIRRLLADATLTQKDIADLIGCTAQVVHKVKHNKGFLSVE
jgi:hypothetical protein